VTVAQRAFIAATRLGARPEDSAVDRLQRGLLVSVLVIVMGPCLAWGALYWLNGERVAALVPWTYIGLCLASLAILATTGAFRLVRSVQLTLILVLPMTLCVLLGGIVPSSGVVLWSFLAPVAAIAFDRPDRAWRWFAGFIGVLLLAIVLPPFVRPDPAQMPDAMVLAFAGLNIGAVGLLCFSLLAAFATERESAQRRVEELLLNVLPRGIVERLQTERGSIADHFDQASVLFADVVDFTPLSQRLPPREVVDMLDRLFTEFDALADALGVEKIKTIGDCYMAASGVPVSRADHAVAIARLALSMRECVGRFPRADDGRPLRIRIGLNAGPVVAGVIGRRRFLYDLWGDAVNTASRMESHGIPNEIMLTRSMYELLADRFVCEPHGPIEVKGKGVVETWLLRGERPSGA
jgi:guanylate cyclase